MARRRSALAQEPRAGAAVGARERAQAVVILLPGRIPEPKVDRLAVNHHIGRVVVKHGRDVLRSVCAVSAVALGARSQRGARGVKGGAGERHGEARRVPIPPPPTLGGRPPPCGRAVRAGGHLARERVRRVGNKETRLADGTVPDHDALNRLHCSASCPARRAADEPRRRRWRRAGVAGLPTGGRNAEAPGPCAQGGTRNRIAAGPGPPGARPARSCAHPEGRSSEDGGAVLRV